MTHYATSPLNKSQTLREEELRQIQEFQIKKQQGVLSTTSIEQFMDQEEQLDEDEQAEREDDEELEFSTRSGFEISDDFFTILVDRDSNTQVTTLQRINTFRQLIFIGNGNGIVGYGQGKGYDFEQALEQAFKDAKRNLVPIPLDLWMTVPVKINSRFYDFELEIVPRARGMNAYGNPQIAVMLMMAGMNHCRFKARSRNQRPYAMVYAFMKAVTQNYTPEDVCELTGEKIYRQYFGKKIGRQTPMTFEGI